MKSFSLYLVACGALLIAGFFTQPPAAKGWLVLFGLLAITIGMYARVFCGGRK